MESLEVITIVRSYLREHGFTGLVNSDGCGCEIDDLVPCNSDFSQCRPGYKHMDPREEHSGSWAIFDNPQMPNLDDWDRVEY